MPRKRTPKCELRGMSQELSLLDELEYSEWGGFQNLGGYEFPHQYRDLVNRHGDVLLNNYIKCIPGSRSWVLYLIGQITWPPLVEGNECQHIRSVGGSPVPDSSAVGHRDTHEFDWLIAQGVVDGREKQRAIERINNGQRGRYEMLVKPRQHEAVVVTAGS